MRPLLCGYYGEHNIGDDLLLRALLAQLPRCSQPVVTARDQLEVERQFGVSTCPRRPLQEVLQALSRCDALVLGGGSLLQDSTSFTSLLYYAALILAARARASSSRRQRGPSSSSLSRQHTTIGPPWLADPPVAGNDHTGSTPTGACKPQAAAMRAEP